VFATQPGFATVDFRDEYKQASMLRAVKPEAVLTLDGTQYNIGDLVENTTTSTYVRKRSVAMRQCGHHLARCSTQVR